MDSFPEYGEPSDGTVFVRGMQRAQKQDPERQLLPPVQSRALLDVQVELVQPPDINVEIAAKFDE